MSFSWRSSPVRRGVPAAVAVVGLAVTPVTALLINLAGGRIIRSTGRVVYELLHADDPIQVGVEFMKLDPSDRATLAVAVPGASGQRC